MRYSGIMIALDDIPTFTPAFQAELRTYAFKGLPAADGFGSADEEESWAVDLGPIQAKRFVEGCSEKTITVLKEIVRRGGAFTADDVAAHLGTPVEQLRGVWGGLTKRVRTITKDSDAVLIDWNKVGEGWDGSITAKTRASLEAALDDY